MKGIALTVIAVAAAILLARYMQSVLIPFVLAGILFWSWLWGVPGMLLAIPMMVVAKVVCDRIEGLRPVANMLGE